MINLVSPIQVFAIVLLLTACSSTAVACIHYFAAPFTVGGGRDSLRADAGLVGV